MQWDIVYKSAFNPDGTLLFPERLTKDFLNQQRVVLGTYDFANQYLNEVIPDEAKVFRKEWIKYYDKAPEGGLTYAFFDPAIGQAERHDFTGISVVTVYPNGDWYIRVAHHYKLTPTQIINKIFEVNKEFSPSVIGVETVAYQEALLYILDEKMRESGVVLPVMGINHRNLSKTARILGLVPRFEWGRMYLAPGCKDFEDEYLMFPRFKNDDILDALASIEEILSYPEGKKNEIKRPNSASDPAYEQWYIRNLNSRQTDDNDGHAFGV